MSGAEIGTANGLADFLLPDVMTVDLDAKIGEIYEGANEIQRWIIARGILGREIAG